MKKILVCLLISLLTQLVYGQKGCYIRLTDKYFYDTIVPDGSWILDNRAFVSDTITSLIYLKKASGRKINISGRGYEPQEVNRKLRSYRKDTLTITMIPDTATIERYRKKMWIANNLSDTLEYADYHELKSAIGRYMACFGTIRRECFGGLCRHSNTYRYYLQFRRQDNVWKAFRVMNSGDTNCDELEEHIQLFPKVFPYFRLSEEPESQAFSIEIFFY